MTIYDLKPKFQDLLRPLCRGLARAGVSANAVTIFAMLLSVLTGMVLWLLDRRQIFLVLVPAVLLVRMALNAIDGMLAREHDMQTSLGAVLNELGDVVADVALYLPFALLTEMPGTLVVLVVVMGVITEMTGVIGVQIGATRRYDGPLGKSDRAFVFGVVALILAAGVTAGNWFIGVFAVVLFLQVLTVLNRARRSLQELGTPPSQAG